MGYSNVDRKGRILIPKAFRDVFSPGTPVVIEMTPEGYLIIRKAVDVEKLISLIKNIKLQGDKSRVRDNAEKGKHVFWGET